MQKGYKIPEIIFRKMNDEGMQEINSHDVFKGKVVAFAVPGAFTPTCSARHLPGFLEHAAAFKEKGIDKIVCISVNDPFVMYEWGRVQKVGDTIDLLADGNAEFTRAVGLSFDAANYGMGTRSQRYAMIVENNVVQQVFVEHPGKFEVSSAENVLKALTV